MLDPPGPPRAQVLRKLHQTSSSTTSTSMTTCASSVTSQREIPEPKSKGIAIISRYPNSADDGAKNGQNLVGNSPPPPENGQISAPRIIQDSTKPAPLRIQPPAPVAEPPRGNKPQPLQCNEVTSSDDDSNSPPPVPKRSNCANNSSRKSLSRELAALTENSDGPSKRTRNQSGNGNQPQVPLKPLPNRRSIVNTEDSDAENDLPNLRQQLTRNQQQNLASASGSSSSSKNARKSSSNRRGVVAKTPETGIQTRALRPRNTPTPLRSVSLETRKRQRSSTDNNTPGGIKIKKTALNNTSKNTSKTSVNSDVITPGNSSRIKTLRSRMN